MKSQIRKVHPVVFFVLAIICIFLIEPISALFSYQVELKGSEKISNAILIATAYFLYWYTCETSELRKLQQSLNEKTNKSIQEQRKQLFLELRPFIRLQWIPPRWRKENELLNWRSGMPTAEDISTSMVAIDVEWPGIRIINEGNGMAINLSLVSRNRPTIYRSIIGPEKATKSYTDAGFEDTTLGGHQEFEKTFDPSKDYKIDVRYQDAAGNEYQQTFKSNGMLNDKFELLEYQVPKHFGKTEFDVVKVKTNK